MELSFFYFGHLIIQLTNIFYFANTKSEQSTSAEGRRIQNTVRQGFFSAAVPITTGSVGQVSSAYMAVEGASVDGSTVINRKEWTRIGKSSRPAKSASSIRSRNWVQTVTTGRESRAVASEAVSKKNLKPLGKNS